MSCTVEDVEEMSTDEETADCRPTRFSDQCIRGSPVGRRIIDEKKRRSEDKKTRRKRQKTIEKERQKGLMKRTKKQKARHHLH